MSEIHSANPADAIESIIKGHISNIKAQLNARAFRAANEITNQIAFVRRGTRSGRVYYIPNTRQKYHASAPGEAPADRTNTFWDGWDRRAYSETVGNTTTFHACAESRQKVKDGKLLGRILEEGAPRARILPRPYKKQIIDRARPGVLRIYHEHY